MDAESSLIIKAYEELGLSIEEIAEEHDFDILAVKSVLGQFSSKYAKDCKINRELDFTDDDLVIANSVIKDLMIHTDDDHLKMRCARYIRDDKKGRKDVAVVALKGLNAGAFEFNELLKRAQASLNATAAKAINQLNDTNPGPSAPNSNVIEAELVETK